MPQVTAFSLIELVVTLATLSILATLAIPAWQQHQSRQRLFQAAENLAQDLRSARSLSLKHNTPYFIHYDNTVTDNKTEGKAGPASITTTHWCYTLSTRADCHCDADKAEPDCPLTMVTGHDYPGIHLNEALFGHQHYTRFDPVRGTALFGHLLIEDNFQRRLQINVSLLGRIRICRPSGDLSHSGFPRC